MQPIARGIDSAPETAGRSASSTGWALAGLSLSMLLSSLGISIANVGLPSLVQAFDASFAQVQWVVLAYLLATTTLVVGAGRLGDVVGRRRLLAVGIAVFTVASLACAAAPGLTTLVVARAVQGTGAAVMMALALALVADAVPKAATGRAMGLIGTMSAIGTALGPSLGGVLIAGFGWRAIFLVNLPLGIAAFVIARRALPADRRVAKADRAGFDTRGTLLLAATLAAYALAMTGGRGAFGPGQFALAAAAIVGGGLFIVSQSRTPSPLIRPALLRDRRLSAGLATSALVATVLMATLVVGPFHLARGLGLDTAVVGLVMSIGPLVAALTGVPAGRAVDRLGTGRMIGFGLAGLAAGTTGLAVAPATLGVAGYVAPLVMVTAGYALFQAANTTAVMAASSAEGRGVVSGLLTLSRNLGLVTGASAMGAVFALGAATDIATAGAVAVVAGTRLTFAVATVLIVVALAIASTAGRGASAEDVARRD